MAITKGLLGPALMIALVTGCATPPTSTPEPPRTPTWFANNRVDEFTDQRSCRVQPEAQIINIVYGANAPIGFYPFVERRGESIRVGMYSGGSVTSPAGRIQLRVDTNEAWTIETSETPIDIQDANARQMMASAPQNMTPEMRRIYEQGAENLSRTLSPYTAASGERAREIIQQMRTGRELIYRQLGANQATTTTGRIALGPDFNAALDKCGL